MTLPDYFLKANLYGLLFAGCYWLFLRRHTFFTLNRGYLLLSAALTLLLPLVSLPEQTTETLPLPVGVIMLPATPIETGPNWERLGFLSYGLIATALVIRLIWQLNTLIRQIQKTDWQVTANCTLVSAPHSQTPTFSFFNFLVLNPADVRNDLIIRHELVHIRQGHSADVVGLALLRAVFWGCPALWLLDRLLRQVHEFLADADSQQPTTYAHFLVAYVFNRHSPTLTNSFFNPSLLKQRILMLHKTATTRWALGKYLLALPLTFGLLAMTTAPEKLTELVAVGAKPALTVSGRITGNSGPLAGANVIVANTRKGTSTDTRGYYKLTNVPADAQLAISYTGFRLAFVPVKNRTSINAKLERENPNELPKMGATAMYRAIKPNPKMPVRAIPSEETINGEVYRAVEEPATFPTGIPGLMNYVAHNLHYPAKARVARVQGTVFVSFVVLPTGGIGSATVQKGIGSGCDEEALRVVREMPRWIPAQQNGKPVATQFTLPIQFALEKQTDTRTGQVVPIQSSSSVHQLSTSVSTILASIDTIPAGSSSLRVRIPSDKPPLYLLDGKEITEQQLHEFNPDTIQSIDVLKGSSATATYGIKGINGVIKITTKKP